MFYDRDGFIVSDEKATADELKALHKLIGKVRTDIEAFSFNTAVSAFMIAVNELYDLKCTKREIVEPLIILLSPPFPTPILMSLPILLSSMWIPPKIYPIIFPLHSATKNRLPKRSCTCRKRIGPPMPENSGASSSHKEW